MNLDNRKVISSSLDIEKKTRDMLSWWINTDLYRMNSVGSLFYNWTSSWNTCSTEVIVLWKHIVMTILFDYSARSSQPAVKSAWSPPKLTLPLTNKSQHHPSRRSPEDIGDKRYSLTSHLLGEIVNLSRQYLSKQARIFFSKFHPPGKKHLYILG